MNYHILMLLGMVYPHLSTSLSAVIGGCPFGYFHCENSKCIASDWKCDGIDDCGDNSDEHVLICPGSTNCTGKFQCKTTAACIPMYDVCDGREDCQDGSDETDCGVKRCESFQFACDDKKNCIPQHFHCDGYVDCQDGSDEKDCPAASLDCSLNNKKYLCRDGKTCIDLSSVCDSTTDCPDSSDEVKDCSNKCESNECSHTCIPTPNGGICSCEKGYEINLIDNKTCTDKDECEEMPEHPCSQICVNTPGSFYCTCHHGYELKEDGRRCRVSATGPEPIFIYSKKSEIRKLYMISQDSSTLVRGLNDVIDIAYEAANNLLYWIDGYDKNIYYTKIDGHDKSKLPAVTVGLKSPEKLSVDWISKKIYIADSGRNEILACTMFNINCVTVVKELKNVKEIAVYPQKRIMYWSEWSTPSTIKCGSMDGQTSQIFLNFYTGQPKSLVLDYATGMLYWINPLHQIIERISLDGTNRKIVLSHQVQNPYSIAIFEDNVIWSQPKLHSAISMANKFSGKSMMPLVKDSNAAKAITVAHPSLQEKEVNPCSDTLCSDVCLLSNNSIGFTCACPLNRKLAEDNLTCIDFKNIPTLFVAVNHEISRYPLSYVGNAPDQRVVVDGLARIKAVSVDPVEDCLYFFDAGSRTIEAVKFESYGTQSSRVIVRDDLWGVDSIAVDWIGRNIYWTDSIKKTVEVSSIDGQVRLIVLKQQKKKPVSVALSPSNGYMYVSAVGDYYIIEKCHMDGTNCLLLMEEDGSPVSLTLDEKAERLYWIEMTFGQIVSVSVFGRDRKIVSSVSKTYTDIIIRSVDHPLSVAVHSDTIFWTDTDLTVNVANITSKDSIEKIFVSNLPGYALLSMLHRNHSVMGACSNTNGGCSHTCLSKPMGESICKCPEDQEISQDLMTCYPSEEKVSCPDGIFSCKDDPSECIEDYLRCDGFKNCMDGSDEKNCTAVSESNIPYNSSEVFNVALSHQVDMSVSADQTYKSPWEFEPNILNSPLDVMYQPETHIVCQDNEFKCDNGICVPEKWVCDQLDDCGDNSDEANCTERACLISQFKCDNDKCLSHSRECNGIKDCEDGSDEADCKPCDQEDFTCSNGQCIHGSWKCDGLAECEDGSDEVNCGICDSFSFTCDNGSCILRELQCDGEKDCGDGSDEKNCIITPTELKDIDECQSAFPVCSQKCEDTKDGYTCSCMRGYKLENEKSCVALDHNSAYFIVSTKNNLRYYNLKGDMLKVFSSNQRGRITALDFHSETKNIYWTSEQGKIICYSTQTQKIKTTKKIYGTSEGIAVDWVGRNIYYTDRSRKQISVCAMTKSLKYCMVLVATKLSSPRAIVVHPQKATMFWSDTDHGAKIESSWMNGENRRTIIGENTFWPNGLAIDYSADILYWVDAHHDVVEGCRLDGSKRFQLAELKHPFSISVFEDNIYIGNWDSNAVEKISKLDRGNITSFPNIIRPLGLKVIHHLLQKPVDENKNPCNHANCEQICLLYPPGAICRCSHGFLKDEMAPNKCKEIYTECAKQCNNGTCIAMAGIEYCSCNPGYTGLQCQQPSNQTEKTRKLPVPDILTSFNDSQPNGVVRNIDAAPTTEAAPNPGGVISDPSAGKEEKKKTWLVGLIIGIIVVLVLVFSVIIYMKKFRKKPDLVGLIRYCERDDVPNEEAVDLVNDMAFGNPNFQDYEDLNSNIVKSNNHMKYNQLNNDCVSLDSAFSSHYGNGNTTMNNDLTNADDD